MNVRKGSLRICPEGHRYYKRSDCPTCPACEAAKKPSEGFLSGLSAPARRALELAGITSVGLLSECTEGEILQLHGSLPELRQALRDSGKEFRTGG